MTREMVRSSVLCGDVVVGEIVAGFGLSMVLNIYCLGLVFDGIKLIPCNAVGTCWTDLGRTQCFWR